MTEDNNNEQGADMEMPRYKRKDQADKQVRALQIKSITKDSVAAKEEDRPTDGSAMITPVEEGYASFKVNSVYMHGFNPKEGGYYVIYEGGEVSYVPTGAFEGNYEKV